MSKKSKKGKKSTDKMYLIVCKHCGWIPFGNAAWEISPKKCFFCDNDYEKYETPYTEDYYYDTLDERERIQYKQKVFYKDIRPSKEFNEKLKRKRIKKQKKLLGIPWYREYDDFNFTEFKFPKPGVECPYCHSTRTMKLPDASSFVMVDNIGVYSGNHGKQWHCHDCKSDF